MRAQRVIFSKKVILITLITLGLLMQSIQSIAQTYALPDTNLRNKLKQDYSSLMIGDELNLPVVMAYAGSLNLNNANISDASGIQYFNNIPSLNLNNNNLTSLPPIPNLTKLTNFYAAYNQLTSLPDFSAAKQLGDFQVHNNQLTSLPSFAGLTSLYSIYCTSNKLTSLPDISQLTNLQILVIGYNDFGVLPDFSPNINLKQLHVHKTGIDTIKGLGNLSNLDQLWAWGNKIRDLSALNSNTKLKLFMVFDNELTSLPKLSNKSLFMVDFSNNKLTFEDILPISGLPSFSSFTFSPQKKIILPSFTVREKDNLTINLNIDNNISSNVYSWYKDSLSLTTTQTGILNIPSVAKSDSGSYYVIITNPGVPGLTLQTTLSHLKINPCLELNSFTSNIISENCMLGTNINFSSINLAGGIGPFTYTMAAASGKDTITYAAPNFPNLPSGKYTLIIKDSRMCEASGEVVIKNPEGCNPVITPDGDGVMDTYFIETPGKVKIFDVGKNLIKEFNAPGVWDGTKSDGSLADAGYYAIVITDQKVIHITLIR